MPLPDDVLAALELLRRHPDVEAPELVAVDAADRLVLAEAAQLLASAGPGDVAVLDDAFGALSLGVSALGAPDVRVATDAVTSERALILNAAEVSRAGLVDASTTGLDARIRVHAALDPAAVTGARVVLVRLPRSLDALAELADLVADHAAPDVVVLATGRLKHMSRSMNDVLGARFAEVSATLAQGKARALVARGPLPRPSGHDAFPRTALVEVPGPGAADGTLTVVAHGAAFAGATLDIGTRALLEVLDTLVDGLPARRADRSADRAGAPRSHLAEPAGESVGEHHDEPVGASVDDPADEPVGRSVDDPADVPVGRHRDAPVGRLDVLDLGCGTGILATVLALRLPAARVVATDRSAAAVLSAARTAAANGVADRVETLRDDVAGSLPDASVDVVVCNPPFHTGTVVTTDVAEAMFAAAARVLRPGGQLWVVANSHLRYRGALERVVGPTTQIARNPKFTVTRSLARER